MCSLSLSALGPEASEVLADAVSEVAEQCFFAEAKPLDAWRGVDPASASALWLIATVQFEEPGCAGSLACMLPDALARALFDAFNGRDPADPEPPLAQVFDLIGELTNMICGAWLTRLANHQAFVLSRPLVHPLLDRLALDVADGSRLTMRINDLPLIVDISVRRTEAAQASAAPRTS